MSNFWITFRISTEVVDDKDYDDRYDELIECIDSHSTAWWDESTSFIIFESESNINILAKACKAAIAPSVDLFLIRNLDSKRARYAGVITDADLLAMVSYAKRV